MTNLQIAALCLGVSAIILAVGGIHIAIVNRRATGGSLKTLKDFEEAEDIVVRLRPPPPKPAPPPARPQLFAGIDMPTVRDEFAAAAPAEAAAWFKYQHPTEKPRLPDYKAELPRELWEQFEGLGDWHDEDSVAAEVRAFNERYDAARDAQEQWSNEFAKARYIAWRWAYADAMLAGRKGGA